MKIVGYFLLLLGAVTLIYMIIHFFYPGDYGTRISGQFDTGVPVIAVFVLGAGVAWLVAYKKK